MENDVKQDVIETALSTDNDGASDELDLILEALGDDTSSDTGGDKSGKNDDGKDYFKKVGNDVFKTEEEYDSWASKNFGELKRINGEMKKLQDRIDTKNLTPEVRKETEQDVEALRMKMRAIDFFEDNPDALGYKEEMAAFLRVGKANDEKGRPSLKIAYSKALRADGKDGDKASQEDNKENIKKIMQSGSGDSGRMSDSPYQSSDDIKAIDDFANSALSGRL